MPKKSKKSTDLEITEIPAAVPDESQVPDETAAPAKKTARKKRSPKAQPAEAAPAAAVDPALEKDDEAAAHAAETFDDAFGSNGPAEAQAHVAELAEVEQAAARPAAAELAPEEADEEEEEEPRPAAPPAKLERLQKILAQAGVASRRHAEEMITEGRVQVNGQVVTTLGSKADPARDHIRVDGKLLQGAERLRYFMLNKPRGYVTTVSDPEGRPTVMEFFTKMGERLYPVGRLDYLSEGLLLVTNDGELANQLTRAASGVEKTYLVKVSGQPTDEQIDQLREGVRIDRGQPGEGRVTTAPARIREIRMGENPWFEVTLIEGRNRELRKMFEEIGHHVEKIRRVGYGPLVLDVEPGKLRELDPEEVHALRLVAAGKWKPKRLKTTAMLPKEAGRSVDHEAARTGNKFGKKPFRGRPRREEGERREFRPSRPGQRDDRGGDRPAFNRGQRSAGSGFDRGPRREGGGFERGPQRRENAVSDRGQRREGFGRADRPQRGAFARPRAEQAEGARPSGTGEQRRFDSRKPGRPFQGDRGPRREGGGGFAKPRWQRPASAEGSGPAERRGPAERPARSDRPPTAGRPARGGQSGAGGYQDRASRPPRGEQGGQRRPYPPRERSERPRGGEGRGEERRSTGDRSSQRREFSPRPRTNREGGEQPREFTGERRGKPANGPRSGFGSRPPRPGGQNRRGPGGGPRPGAGPRGNRGGGRPGGPARRP
ncbi:MAG: pseudouridine synthase [Acidobacteriota bacterium]